MLSKSGDLVNNPASRQQLSILQCGYSHSCCSEIRGHEDSSPTHMVTVFEEHMLMYYILGSRNLGLCLRPCSRQNRSVDRERFDVLISGRFMTYTNRVGSIAEGGKASRPPSTIVVQNSPSRKPFLNRRASVFIYRMRPVPVVLRPMAFCPHWSAIPEHDEVRRLPAELTIIDSLKNVNFIGESTNTKFLQRLCGADNAS